MTATRLLRRPEVESLTGLSRARIYEEMAAGRFPRPVKTGLRSVAWVDLEIDEWQKQLIAKRDSQSGIMSAARSQG